jgi:Family of unknown function (DUF5709)
MTDRFERAPEYDPESVGLPDTVDPDSTAFDERESVREADGPGTPLAPFHTPVALNEFDQTQLDQRLRAEVPDVGANDPDEYDVARANARADVADDELEADDYPDDEAEPDRPVGRLAVAFDDGSGGLHDATFAEDEGFAGGGASAEESAMHVIGE